MEKETLYARWLSNQLTEEEIQELKSSGDWDILESIKSETDTWQLPAMSPEHLQKVQAKIEKIKDGEEAKVIPINRWAWAYRAASIVIVMSAVYWFFFRQDIVIYENKEGQTSTIQLPDSTEVRLIGRSRIRYDKKNFARARKVNLEGHGHLAVRRKGAFTAVFDGGEVQVLGTEFEIMDGKNVSFVKCYEGKVKVITNNNETDLIPGQGVKINERTNQTESISFEAQQPSWFTGESVFENTSLAEVIEALQIQYDLEIDASRVDVSRKYSGKFGHSDLSQALNMVFTPMGIEYSQDSKNPKKVTLN